MYVCTTIEREQWNAFLMSQSSGHLLQSYEWGELIQYQKDHIYRLGALENGRLVGTMMLSVVPLPLSLSVSGLRLTWLYCSRGPAVEHPHAPALTALLKHAHAIGRREHAIVLRLEPNITDDDPAMHAWLSTYRTLGFQTNPIAVHGRRSWVLDLRPAIDQLLANFRKAWRQDIRIAQQRGVIVREARSDADFDTYYHLLKSTSERDGFFIHGKEHHKEILRLFASKGDAVIYLAELAGEPLAAKMLIRFGTWCYDMFGASANSHHNIPKTHLLQFRCLQWAKEHGCTYFDFRTVPEILQPGEEMWGVYQFKKGFGGFSRLHLPTLDYVYRPLIYTAWHRAVAIRRRLRRAWHHRRT
jgi:lipid II:glycine glycyltransferase (peptidoglycan interpeptide bridge formation enzyme)